MFFFVFFFQDSFICRIHILKPRVHFSCCTSCLIFFLSPLPIHHPFIGSLSLMTFLLCSAVQSFFFIPPLTFNCFLISFQQKKFLPLLFIPTGNSTPIAKNTALSFLITVERESLVIVLCFVWVKCRSPPDLFLMPVCAHQSRVQFEESKWTQKERVSSFCDCSDAVLAVLQLGGAWLLQLYRSTQERGAPEAAAE